MAAPKGRPKPEGAGRTKGTPNKVTSDLKMMMLGALNSGDGGQAFLERQKQENPVAFLNFISKFIPRDIKLDGDVGISVSIGHSTGFTHSLIEKINNADKES